MPLDPSAGETLVLRKRTACPAPEPFDEFGKGKKRGSKPTSRKKYEKEEDAYEEIKVKTGFPASGYLIGRHPECGMEPSDDMTGILLI